jgi:hypothetical protein
MSNSPSTFRAEPSDAKGIAWDHCASLHRRKGGGGVFFGFKALRQGSLAELVRFVASLPESERDQYVIEKAGDHRIEAAEIMALAKRSDFPG